MQKLKLLHILGLPITLITFFTLNSALVEEMRLKGPVIFDITLNSMLKLKSGKSSSELLTKLHSMNSAAFVDFSSTMLILFL